MDDGGGMDDDDEVAETELSFGAADEFGAH